MYCNAGKISKIVNINFVVTRVKKKHYENKTVDGVAGRQYFGIIQVKSETG